MYFLGDGLNSFHAGIDSKKFLIRKDDECGQWFVGDNFINFGLGDGFGIFLYVFWDDLRVAGPNWIRIHVSLLNWGVPFSSPR